MTSGVAHDVPVLLMPELGGRSLRDLQKLVRLEDVSEPHTRCYVIEGTQGGGALTSITRLWIGQTVPWLARISTAIQTPDRSAGFVATYLARGC